MKRNLVFTTFVVATTVGAYASGPLGPEALTDENFPAIDMPLADLGHLLFFDPVLSGNQNIACATCHHPGLGTSDAMSLSVGEGAIGLGSDRAVAGVNIPQQRIPRNAPALFNLGANDVTALFHDGRVELDQSAAFGIRMPEGRALERAVPSVLAAQSMLPMLSADEMAGHPGENNIANAVVDEKIHGEGGAWDLIASRVEEIPAYKEAFFALNGREDVHITDIAAAIGSFIADEFRAGNSLADRHVAGLEGMPDNAVEGAKLFVGKAGCSDCHNGPLLSDGDFHAIAMPQIGPGKMEGEGYYRDEGRYAVTGIRNDMYRFRTPSLRNIALTAPYGHDGAFARLEDVVQHHLDPKASLMGYTADFATLDQSFDTGSRSDFAALMDQDELLAIAAANELSPVLLTDNEISALLAYLDCLTDDTALTAGRGVPNSVPSGIALDVVK